MNPMRSLVVSVAMLLLAAQAAPSAAMEVSRGGRRRENGNSPPDVVASIQSLENRNEQDLDDGAPQQYDAVMHDVCTSVACFPRSHHFFTLGCFWRRGSCWGGPVLPLRSRSLEW